MHKKNCPIRYSSKGFSLIELSIVLTIISLLLIPGIKLYKSWIDQSRQAANQQRINVIQQALSNFIAQYGRLPCPASFIAQQMDATYGREITPLCLKPNGKPYTPDGKATFGVTGRSTPVQNPPINPVIIIGSVPVRDLGLPDSARTDVYGHLFTYAVSAAAAAALQGGPGVIDVVDAAGHTVLPYASDKISTGTALYVLVDHGKDGKGAYADNPGPAAATPAVPCTRAPGLDTLNCSFELARPASPFAFRSALFGNQPGANWFDDTIVFYTHLTPDIPALPTTAAPNCQATPSAIGCAQPLNDLLKQGGPADKEVEEALKRQLKDLQQQGQQLNDLRKELEQMQQYGQ